MFVDREREISIAVFLLVLAAVLAFFAPNFFSTGNFRSILINTSYIAIAAFGGMLAILTGQPDISVGSILAVCSVVAGLLSKAGVPVPLVFLSSVAIGLLLGLVNGLLVTRLHVHSIIVTLGTLGIYRGALLYFTDGAWVYDLPRNFRLIGLGTLAGIPNPIWIAVLTLFLGSLVLRHTAWGRSLYAVGSNSEAARLAGIRTPFMIASALAANGAVVGVAAMVYSTRFSTIQSNVGSGFEFLVITAVVVGGAHIFGGSGTVLGVALGALLVGVTGTVLVFLDISAYWERTLHGLFILAAVSFGVVRARQRRTVRARPEAAT
jgi:rhamnose transport system permease protein